MSNKICLTIGAIALCALPALAKAQATAPRVVITRTTLTSRSSMAPHVPARSGRVLAVAASPRAPLSSTAPAISPLTAGQAVRVSLRPAPVTPRR